MSRNDGIRIQLGGPRTAASNDQGPRRVGRQDAGQIRVGYERDALQYQTEE